MSSKDAAASTEAVRFGLNRGSSTCGVCVRGTGRVPRAYPHAMRCGAYVGSREPPSASCSTRSRVGGVCTGFLQRSLESCPGCLIAGLTNRGQKFFLRGRGGKATNLPELHTTTFCQRASTCCLLSRWEVYVWPTYFQFRATAAVETSQHDALWARSSLEDIARAALLLRRRRLGQPLFALGHELLPFHL